MTLDRRFLCWALRTVLVRRASAAAPLLALGLLAAVLAGCGASFDSPVLLSKLRLLALRAAPVNPAQGETTTMTPLIYSPSDTPLELAWSWCPLLGQANDGYVCPISHDDASTMLAAAGVTAPLPAFDLGTGPTVSFTNPFPPDLLAALCGAGFDGQRLDCSGGFPIRISVRVTQGAAAQLGTTVVNLPIAPGAVSNANPIPGALSVELAAGTQTLDDLGSVQVPRVQDSLLHVAIDDGQAETYAGLGLDGGTATLRETLLFSWFAELGDFENSRTLFIDGANSMADASADKWKPPATRVDARLDLAPDRRRPRRSGRRGLDHRHRLAGADAMKRAEILGLLGLLALAAAAPALAADAPATGGLTKLPKQLVFVDATYPPDAAAAGLEADVVLNLTVDADGHVSHAGVATSAGPGREAFDTAAVAAAAGYLFEPAESDGKPVAVELAYKVKFRLHARTPAPPPPSSTAPLAPAPRAAAKAPPRESLVGQLRERGTRSPLVGVVVTASKESASPPEAYEATTDGDGRFAFFDLAPGAWHVEVETPTYFPFRTSEEVRRGEKTVVTYYVERGQGSPLDVTVTAARPKKDVTHVVLTPDVIARVPGTAGDPLAVLQDLAGVARAPAGSGLLIVRGSAPEDTQIFVDGMDVPLVYHFGGLRSVLPEGIIDNIEFVPGNFSPEYGRAIGGIVDVHLKELRPKRFGGYVDVSVLDTGIYLEAPLGNRGGIAVAARRSYLDAVVKAAASGSDQPVNWVTLPVYYDAQLLVNYRLSPAHDLRALAFGADDRLALLFKNPADFSQQATGNQLNTRTGFWRALVADHYTPREGLDNTLRLSAGQDVETISLGDLVLDLHRRVVQVRDTLRLRLQPWVTLVAGTDAVAEHYSGHVRLPPPPKEGQPMSNQDLSDVEETHVNVPWWLSPGVFAELELRPTKPLLISAGVRADYFQVVHQGVLAPRLSARYDLSPRWAVKGALGLYYQTPNVEETDAAFGNPALKAERAVHLAAGAEWRPWTGTTFDATGFYKRLSNLVSPTDATHVVNGAEVPLTYDNGGRGRVIGLELVARRELAAGFVGWIAYTLSRSERLDSGQTDWRLFDFDQTHILAAVAAYDLPRHWRIASRFRYVSGNPETPVVGSVFNSVTDEYDPVFGPVNSARQPSFVQLDLRLDKQWVFDRWLFDAYLDLQNATNHTNPEGIAYNYDYTQSKVSQGLPILPFLGLRAEF